MWLLRCQRRNKATDLVALALWLALASCGGDTSLAPDRVLPRGAWGGEHARLTVEAASAAIEFDCAHGALDVPILLDRNGRFDVPGVFVRERGGPVRLDDPPDSHPARYVGTTDGRSLTLTVTLLDSVQNMGTYTLVLGMPPRLVKCL